MEDVPVFPDEPAITVERTLAIIKPDAIHYAEEIIEEIKANGFTIVQVSILLVFFRTKMIKYILRFSP